jgi:hypothetical protein
MLDLLILVCNLALTALACTNVIYLTNLTGNVCTGPWKSPETGKHYMSWRGKLYRVELFEVQEEGI